jgi:hypothetical protein
MGMNERIRELEDQASQYASRETTDLDEWEFIFRKKFAELIVRDVVEQIITQERTDGEWYQTDIFKHFGVEE